MRLWLVRMLVLELLLSAGITLSGTLFVAREGRSEPSPEVSFRIECFWHLDHLGQNRFDATHFLVSKNAQVQMFFELCVFPFVIEEMFQLLEPS